jgi:4-hydroxybenzoate polyprenyltransferase
MRIPVGRCSPLRTPSPLLPRATRRLYSKPLNWPTCSSKTCLALTSAFPKPLRLGAAFHSSGSNSTPPTVKVDNPSRLSPTLVSTAFGSVYKPPTAGIFSLLPASWVPYAELSRLDKPAGTYYLFFPCMFSTLLAAPMAIPMATPGSVAGTVMLFFGGALIMRGAGCTINDLWDRNLDPHVSRTRFRPIARGAITPFKGIAYTGAQLLTGLAICLQLPIEVFYYAVPSLPIVALYPLAKRVTYYPQFVLGLAFSWGAIVGFPALGVDLLSNSAALTTVGCLYSSNIAWTVLYDMIYAHMDIKDDVKAGIKSIALKHEAETKKVLSGLAVTQIALLGGAGIAAGAGPAFFVGSCGAGLMTLAIMIRRVNLKNPKDCWWWFVNGCWITGGVISLGMAADYLGRYANTDMKEIENTDEASEAA